MEHDAALFAVGMALTSSVVNGAAQVCIKQGLAAAHSATGVFIALITTTALLWCLAPFLTEAAEWRSDGVWVFAALGFVRPFLTMNLIFAGNHRLGPTVSHTVLSTDPLLAALGAIALLGEPITAPVVAGTLAIVGGAMVLASRGGRPTGWARAALVFPVGAAVVRGSSHLVAKAGLRLLPNPFMAALVAHTTALAFAAAEHRLRGRTWPRAALRGGARWFVLVGVMNVVIVWTLFAALHAGRVSVVAPISASSPLFTLVLSWLFLRTEALTPRVVAGVLLIVPGVVLIGLTR